MAAIRVGDRVQIAGLEGDGHTGVVVKITRPVFEFARYYHLQLDPREGDGPEPCFACIRGRERLIVLH